MMTPLEMAGVYTLVTYVVALILYFTGVLTWIEDFTVPDYERIDCGEELEVLLAPATMPFLAIWFIVFGLIELLVKLRGESDQ